MKKLIRYTLVLLLFAGALVFGNAGILHELMPDTVAAEAATLKLNKKKVTLEKGGTYKLKIKGMPEGAKLVKYKSGKKSVAKVGKKTGTITAVSAGKATVSAVIRLADGTTKTLKCKVTVKTPNAGNTGDTGNTADTGSSPAGNDTGAPAESGKTDDPAAGEQPASAEKDFVYTAGMYIDNMDDIHAAEKYCAEHLLNLECVIPEDFSDELRGNLRGLFRKISTQVNSSFSTGSEAGTWEVSITPDYNISYMAERAIIDPEVADNAGEDTLKYAKEGKRMTDEAIKGKKTLKDKIIACHDYLIDHFSYDTSGGPNSHSIVGFIESGKAVCDGYAMTFKMMLEYIGVDAEPVTGPGHMWLRFLYDGEWKYADVTYDETLTVHDGKLSRKYITDKSGNFLGEKEFYAVGHMEESN
ncbi:MAG: Ig-like domain-containing protein [Lachnospiraceae bacterium]|nr:Ig-like domain-containing protein [Lachnospiraceae bacterium]